MTPLLITLATLAIPHMKYMYHQFEMSGNIIQENIGKNLIIVVTTGLKIIY